MQQLFVVAVLLAAVLFVVAVLELVVVLIRFNNNGIADNPYKIFKRSKNFRG